MAGTNLFYFLIPYFLLDVAGHRPAVAGAVLLAMPAAMAATSLALHDLAGAWADRLGPRLLVRCGVAVVIAGELLLLTLDAGAHPMDAAWRLAVIGAGKGLFMGPNQTVILAALPRDAAATVGGVSTLVRWLGYALGPALGALCWTLAGGGIAAMRSGVAVALAVTVAAAVCCVHTGRGHSGRAMDTRYRSVPRPWTGARRWGRNRGRGRR